MPPPEVVIVGGMKCGTTALHGYLADHPAIGMSEPKELDFFFGDRPTGPGNWWRGVAWYADRFPAGAELRGEASPGYTSPDHPEVAARMATVIPGVRVLYLARDPLERAVSQYLHHRRDGDEDRPMAAALLDPASQYIARSRHFDRLASFLASLPRDRIRVVEHRDLLTRRRDTLRAVFGWLGVDTEHWSPELLEEHNTAGAGHPELPRRIVAAFRAAVADDAERFDALLRTGLRLVPTSVSPLRPAVESEPHGVR